MVLCRIKKDIQFIRSLITKIVTIVETCGTRPPPPPVKLKKVVGSALEYETEAVKTDTITLKLDGFILYLYAKAFNDIYPESNPTPQQVANLKQVYDALELPFPKR
jgi:hypothetical protein